MGSLRRLSHVASVLAAVLTGCVVEERELCKDAFDPKSLACSLQYCEKHATEPDCVLFLDGLVDAGLIDRSDGSTGGDGDSAPGRDGDAGSQGDASGGEDADTPFKPSQCSNNEDCKLLTSPVCEDGTCRQCKSDGECAWRADAPACSDGACVPCSASNDKLCTDQGQLCKTGGSKCVACNTSADCKDPQNSLCNAESKCEPCQGHGDCAHLPNTPLCHQQQCVACLPGARDTCGNNVCDMVSQDVPVCAQGKAPRSAFDCQPCVSDEQCQEGQLCVPQRWDSDGDNGKETLVGWFCQWKKVPDGDTPRLCDSGIRPYVEEVSLPSADSPNLTHTVCTLRASTCSAHQVYSSSCGRGPGGLLVENRTRDANGNTISPPLTAQDIQPDDSVCGIGGRCVARNTGDGAYLCSMGCVGSNGNDCPKGAPVVCGGSPPNVPGVCGVGI